ncbi:11876_t:CDS:2 [Entrophospora sp. SA101]|nr:11876_t:CDS:2 [Entrophospora sp. SA101]
MSSYYIEEDDSFTTTTNINESLAEINSLASTSICKCEYGDDSI